MNEKLSFTILDVNDWFNHNVVPHEFETNSKILDEIESLLVVDM